MECALTVTRPDGSTFTYDSPDGPLPYVSKVHAALAIERVYLSEGLGSAISFQEVKRVIQEVSDAPFGTPMRHHASGYSFTIDKIRKGRSG